MAQFLGYGDGRSGAVSSASGQINTYATATATAASSTVTTSLSVSIGDIVALFVSVGGNAGKWELVKVATAPGSSFTTVQPIVNTYSSGNGDFAVKFPQYTPGTNSNTLNPGVQFQSNWLGIGGFIVSGPVTLAGTYSATSVGAGGGAGPDYGFIGAQGSNNRNPDNAGDGTGGWLAPAQTAANGNGGGGGNGSQTGGGGGGNGASGGGGTAGSGGNIVGTTDLTTFSVGGGGGSAGGESINTGSGGYGGGGWIIIAKNITVTGTVTANGGNGSQSGSSNGGGGGGAGGSILFKGQNINIGTNLVTASGGSGGGPNAGAGSVGRIYAAFSGSFSGSSTTPVQNSGQDNSLADQGGLIFL